MSARLVLRLTGLAALVLLTACAKPAVPPLDAQATRALWTAFLADPPEPVGSFSLSGSLSLTHPRKSARLLVRFWGDADKPLRLDLSASTGALFAMWREDASGWLAVYPGSNQVFRHADTRAGLARLGVPLPFGLEDLAALVCGRYSRLLPPNFSGVKQLSDGFEFTFSGNSRVANLVLDAEGRPLRLAGRGVEPWTVVFSDHVPPQEGRKPLPRVIHLTTPGGASIVLRIKKMELLQDKMPEASLDLAVPPSARLTILDKAGEVRTPDLP